MNSWKTIDVAKQYGNCRLLFFSVFTILMSFVLIYTLFSVFSTHVILYGDQTMVFFSLLLLLYPVHKLLHYLPLRLLCKKVKTSWSLKWNVVLTCRVNVHDPIRKHLYLLTLVLPFFIMSVILIGCALSFPHYIHYFTILLSLHTGLCVSDFIYIKNLVGSPRHSFIEEHLEGYDILIQK
ncbi:DUF3267 domain-containing protein [Peribacillus sp. NPDC101481]|uniref:DUF3267 domain-containing protein n=2 Tax=Bacillaceae TaxID=186817 RepID=UPI000C340D12|nr:hypothetical protein CW306_15370 [Bacillus sp. BA3]